jgi:hypothetical protein
MPVPIAQIDEWIRASDCSPGHDMFVTGLRFHERPDCDVLCRGNSVPLKLLVPGRVSPRNLDVSANGNFNMNYLRATPERTISAISQCFALGIPEDEDGPLQTLFNRSFDNLVQVQNMFSGRHQWFLDSDGGNRKIRMSIKLFNVVSLSMIQSILFQLFGRTDGRCHSSQRTAPSRSVAHTPYKNDAVTDVPLRSHARSLSDQF